ncbi:AcrR family transcriptional regulator [Crossiella equi]|uniref:AcrR family transcriptional regulator n=1 Tax=Crossiella equi TaxID=130796 RepID=A0ABS5ASD4_9PSEU|nr:TetR/AcrR family transcriptional regulator [Crossiella equi]MBP2479132.1 AcrR family transcriptional regulator [Crossiella equi]
MVEKKTRSDAVRNRAKLLEVAFETFAGEGLQVPVDEIARRAGVGAGTVYRHFPTKEALYAAIVTDQFHKLINEGEALVDAPDPGAAFFGYFTGFIRQVAAHSGMLEAFAGLGYDIEAAAPEAECQFKRVLGRLLERAQEAGAVRADVVMLDVKAVLMGGQAAVAHRGPEEAERVIQVLCAGLRPVTLR